MPCDSRIDTKLTNGERIAESLQENGYKVTHMTKKAIIGEKGGSQIAFSRPYGEEGTYSATGYLRDLSAISMKYAEIGVSVWAKRRGYSILENDGVQMKLINRRG